MRKGRSIGGRDRFLITGQEQASDKNKDSRSWYKLKLAMLLINIIPKVLRRVKSEKRGIERQ